MQGMTVTEIKRSAPQKTISVPKSNVLRDNFARLTQGGRKPRHRQRRVPYGLVLLSLGLMMGLGPFERLPGGKVTGPVVGTPVDDWQFVEHAGRCALEVRPEYPHSVTVNCWHSQGRLFIGCMACEGKVWSSYISDNPAARVRISGSVYPVALQRVESEVEMLDAWSARWSHLKREPPLPQVPEGYWLYRVVSR